MYIPFENIPDESRIWIYQSNRKLADDEVVAIEKKCLDSSGIFSKGIYIII
jgi:hypothetical protein